MSNCSVRFTCTHAHSASAHVTLHQKLITSSSIKRVVAAAHNRQANDGWQNVNTGRIVQAFQGHYQTTSGRNETMIESSQPRALIKIETGFLICFEAKASVPVSGLTNTNISSVILRPELLMEKAEIYDIIKSISVCHCPSMCSLANWLSVMKRLFNRQGWSTENLFPHCYSGRHKSVQRFSFHWHQQVCLESFRRQDHSQLSNTTLLLIVRGRKITICHWWGREKALMKFGPLDLIWLSTPTFLRCRNNENRSQSHYTARDPIFFFI